MRRARNQFDLFVASPPAATTPLGGLLAELDDKCRCGSVMAIIDDGVPPHAASLECTHCHRFRGWMAKAEHSFICAVIKQCGALDMPVKIRRNARSGAARRADVSSG
jgi:hypothetical protein